MSTASGTSLGDSGTHSDPDEKKTEVRLFVILKLCYSSIKVA